MPVELSIKDKIATIVLNRPEAMNSLDPESKVQLVEAWKEISRNPDVFVAVLTGAGERAFCTGSDLKKSIASDASVASEIYGSAKPDVDFGELATPKPVIAAINGYALGGGLELALMCDIRIASRTAAFGLPEVCMGSMPGAGGTQRLVRAIRQSDAMALMLTGERIDAAEALRIGLVSRVVEPGELLAAAMELAAKLARNAPLATSAIKYAALAGGELPLAAGLTLERHAFGLLRDTLDRQEGRTAFREKRKPVFQGR
jgi:E-phenylitaconyl-CoA hydratase